VNRYITDSGRCNTIPAATVSRAFFDELIFNSGLRVTQEGSGCNYSIDADHYISSTGATALGGSSGIKPTEADIDREFFTHISFTDRMGVKDLGDCKYEVWSQGVEALDLSCAGSSAYCGSDNHVAADPVYGTPSMTGLVAGRGLGLYYITGATPENGMHYLESTLKISSGCSTTGYIRGLETITLGCGLSGTPEDTCTDEEGEKIGSCEMTLNLNPLACPGTVTDVRYVDDICCTGGGIEIIYKHLRFSSCGLFTGVTGTDSCS
jgi:hypothetical protein